MIRYHFNILFSLLLLRLVKGGGTPPFKAKIANLNEDSTTELQCISPLKKKFLQLGPCEEGHTWTLQQIRPGAYTIYLNGIHGKCWIPKATKKKGNFLVRLGNKDCGNWDRVLFRFDEIPNGGGDIQISEGPDEYWHVTSDWKKIPNDFVLHALPPSGSSKNVIQFRKLKDVENTSPMGSGVLWALIQS